MLAVCKKGGDRGSAGSSIRAGVVAAVGAGVLGWLILTGSEINFMGVLTITGLADRGRLGTTVIVALVVALVTRRRPAAAR